MAGTVGVLLLSEKGAVVLLGTLLKKWVGMVMVVT